MEVNEDLKLADKPPFDPKPVELEMFNVKLVPLAMEHAEQMHKAGWNENLFRYLPLKYPMTELDHFRSWISGVLEEADRGERIPFAIIHKEDDCAVGSTSYHAIQRAHRGLEIGWTWIGSDYQRSPVNTECKWLLLKHAFEELGAVRVQLKTDKRNLQSQKAIERIGAKKEGVLRNHVILPDGYIRDSVMYAVTDKDWFREVKAQLQLRLL
jgi:RimJ/RimL family protein N-acetyltransferase